MAAQRTGSCEICGVFIVTDIMIVTNIPYSGKFCHGANFSRFSRHAGEP